MCLEPSGATENRDVPGELAVFSAVTRYEFSCLPESHEERRYFSIYAEYRGRGKWAVVRDGYCYDADMNYEYERSSSNRTDEFLEKFRHEFVDAIALAAKIAPTLTVNGYTVSEVLKDGK